VQNQPAPHQTWIQWFTALEGHDFLFTIDGNFLKDFFNSVQLSELNVSTVRLAQCRSLLNRNFAPTAEEL